MSIKKKSSPLLTRTLSLVGNDQHLTPGQFLLHRVTFLVAVVTSIPKDPTSWFNIHSDTNTNHCHSSAVLSFLAHETSGRVPGRGNALLAQLQRTWFVQVSSKKPLKMGWSLKKTTAWCCNLSNSNSVQALKLSSASRWRSKWWEISAEESLTCASIDTEQSCPKDTNCFRRSSLTWHSSQ